MKIFLSASYTSKLDPAGAVRPRYRAFLETVIGSIEATGHTVRCAPREDNWRIGSVTPAQGVRSDLTNIDKSSVVVALLGPKASSGVQLEIGYALASRKPLLLCAPPQTKLSFTNQGILSNKLATYLNYSEPADLSAGILRFCESMLP